MSLPPYSLRVIPRCTVFRKISIPRCISTHTIGNPEKSSDDKFSETARNLITTLDNSSSIPYNGVTVKSIKDVNFIDRDERYQDEHKSRDRFIELLDRIIGHSNDTRPYWWESRSQKHEVGTIHDKLMIFDSDKRVFLSNVETINHWMEFLMDGLRYIRQINIKRYSDFADKSSRDSFIQIRHPLARKLAHPDSSDHHLLSKRSVDEDIRGALLRGMQIIVGMLVRITGPVATSGIRDPLTRNYPTVHQVVVLHYLCVRLQMYKNISLPIFHGTQSRIEDLLSPTQESLNSIAVALQTLADLNSAYRKQKLGLKDNNFDKPVPVYLMNQCRPDSVHLVRLCDAVQIHLRRLYGGTSDDVNAFTCQSKLGTISTEGEMYTEFLTPPYSMKSYIDSRVPNEHETQDLVDSLFRISRYLTELVPMRYAAQSVKGHIFRERITAEENREKHSDNYADRGYPYYDEMHPAITSCVMFSIFNRGIISSSSLANFCISSPQGVPRRVWELVYDILISSKNIHQDLSKDNNMLVHFGHNNVFWKTLLSDRHLKVLKGSTKLKLLSRICGISEMPDTTIWPYKRQSPIRDVSIDISYQRTRYSMGCSNLDSSRFLDLSGLLKNIVADFQRRIDRFSRISSAGVLSRKNLTKIAKTGSGIMSRQLSNYIGIMLHILGSCPVHSTLWTYSSATELVNLCCAEVLKSNEVLHSFNSDGRTDVIPKTNLVFALYCISNISYRHNIGMVYGNTLEIMITALRKCGLWNSVHVLSCFGKIGANMNTNLPLVSDKIEKVKLLKTVLEKYVDLLAAKINETPVLSLTPKVYEFGQKLSPRLLRGADIPNETLTLDWLAELSIALSSVRCNHGNIWIIIRYKILEIISPEDMFPSSNISNMNTNRQRHSNVYSVSRDIVKGKPGTRSFVNVIMSGIYGKDLCFPDSSTRAPIWDEDAINEEMRCIIWRLGHGYDPVTDVLRWYDNASIGGSMNTTDCVADSADASGRVVSCYSIFLVLLAFTNMRPELAHVFHDLLLSALRQRVRELDALFEKKKHKKRSISIPRRSGDPANAPNKLVEPELSYRLNIFLSELSLIYKECVYLDCKHGGKLSLDRDSNHYEFLLGELFWVMKELNKISNHLVQTYRILILPHVVEGVDKRGTNPDESNDYPERSVKINISSEYDKNDGNLDTPEDGPRGNEVRRPKSSIKENVRIYRKDTDVIDRESKNILITLGEFNIEAALSVRTILHSSKCDSTIRKIWNRSPLITDWQLLYITSLVGRHTHHSLTLSTDELINRVIGDTTEYSCTEKQEQSRTSDGNGIGAQTFAESDNQHGQSSHASDSEYDHLFFALRSNDLFVEHYNISKWVLLHEAIRTKRSLLSCTDIGTVFFVLLSSVVTGEKIERGTHCLFTLYDLLQDRSVFSDPRSNDRDIEPELITKMTGKDKLEELRGYLSVILRRGNG